MSHQNCDRCGARYRDDHTCEDLAEIADLRARVEALEAEVAELKQKAEDVSWASMGEDL